MGFEQNEDLPDPPDGNPTLWRYLEFPQLMSILEEGSLWFTQADNFEDPYEGAFPSPDVETAFNRISHKGSKVDKQEFYKDIQRPDENFISDIFLNCWHVNEHESAAMWEQYSRADSGVAIRSSLDRLKAALNKSKQYDINLSSVDYIDFRTENIPDKSLPNRFLIKRKSYKHEDELRAIIQLDETIEVETDVVEDSIIPMVNPVLDKQPVPRVEPYATIAGQELPPGLPVSVDTDILIDKVFVAPDAPDYVKETLKEIANTYSNLTPDDVEQSSLKTDYLM